MAISFKGTGVLALTMVVCLLPGCVFVPALEERRTLHHQTSWVMDHCRTDDSEPMVIGETGRKVPIRLIQPPSTYKCDGVTVSSDAIYHAWEGEIPRDPNGADTAVAYFLDSILVMIAAPIVIAVVAASARGGGGGGGGNAKSVLGMEYNDMILGTGNE